MIRTRAVAAAAVALIVGVAFGIRAISDGPLEQYSGTALYASLVYAGIFVLRPATAPVRAGVLAVGFCWAVEFLQLTGIPAALSARSLAARLALGVTFDRVDIAWYPAGIVPLVVLHLLINRRAAVPAASVGPGSRAGRPPA